MSLSLLRPDATEMKPRIVVFGVGGAGGNAVNNMIDAGLEGVEFVVANTDAQHLSFAKTDRRIQLGETITEGLGAGAAPEVGMNAAEESADDIHSHLDGAHMVFITAGMGGGTGTGAAPVIAKCARDRGILTVGVVTKPFTFEGRHRMRLADAGIAELQRYVDTLIVIPNQNLFRVANERTTFSDAFGMADQVLHSGVRSITDLMILPGLINLDFADVRAVMSEMGKAMMGTGEASGEDRALQAAQNAIANPLLDETSLQGAKAVLVNITGGMDMTLLEVDEAANAIANEVDDDANIIFGAAFDPELEGKIRVSVVATGMDEAVKAQIEPTRGSLMDRRPANPLRQPTPATPTLETTRSPSREPIAATAERAPVTPTFAPQPAAATASATSASSWRNPAPISTPAPMPETRATETVAPPPQASMPEREPIIHVAETRTLDPIVDPWVEEYEETHPEAASPTLTAQGDLYMGRGPQGRSSEAEAQEQPKRGWSLFGGGRKAAAAPEPAPQAQIPTNRIPVASQRGNTAEAIDPAPEEDLEIPSFLRRLAN